MKFCNYETHESADILPMMEPDEYADLKADIQRHGLLHPIVIHQGKILDGRNRARACEELGIPPKTVLWLDCGIAPVATGSALEWVLATNVTRRHLTPSQRAAVALKSLPMLEAEAEERQRAAAKATNTEKPVREIIPEASKGKAVEKAARQFGVNPRYIQDAKKIKEQSPEVFEKVKAGEISLPDAKRTLALTAAIPTPAERHPDDKDSDTLFHLKRHWNKARKTDRALFITWLFLTGNAHLMLPSEK